MEQYIDVSGLEPPQPMEVILDALADLPPDDHLRVRLRRDPVPLYRLLAQMGYCWKTYCPEPGHIEVLIWPADMPTPDGAEDGGPR